jgi:hypothetical protein
MVARRYSGLSSREVCLRVRVWLGSCELVRPRTGEERAETEREGELRVGLLRKSSRLFFSDVGVGEGEGASAESEVLSRREGVRRVGVGVEPATGERARPSLSSRALFSLSIAARVAGPGTTNLGGGARAEA